MIIHRQARHTPQRGFSLLELAIVVAIVGLLLAILLPVMAAARARALRNKCAGNQRAIGAAWHMHLDEFESFPSRVEGAGPWSYAGVTFSSVDRRPSLDFARPFNRYLSQQWKHADDSVIFRSPLDEGITAGEMQRGAAVASAYESYGTSYRANDLLFQNDGPLRRSEITAEPSRLVILGAPFWHEVIHETGGAANWYGKPDSGIVLFLDDSTRMITVAPGQFEDEEWTFLPGRTASKPGTAQEGGAGD